MAVNQYMALETESDKVFFGTLAGVAAKLFVIDFQIRHRAAGSSLPAIPTQQNTNFRRLSYPGNPTVSQPASGTSRAHETLSLRTLTNSCRCFPGRNLKNLVIENSSVSGISVVRVGSGQEVRTDDCQAAVAGSVTSQHHSRRFDRSLARSMTGIWLWYSLN